MLNNDNNKERDLTILELMTNIKILITEIQNVNNDNINNLIKSIDIVVKLLNGVK